MADSGTICNTLGETMKHLRYDLYCAVSSGPQEKSLPDQEKELRDFVARQGGVVANVYGDKKASSGKNGPRQTFLDLIKHYQNHPEQRPDVLTAIRNDRFGRSGSSTDVAVQAVMSLGVRVWPKLEGERTDDNELLHVLTLQIAKGENKVKVAKLRQFRKRVADANSGKQLAMCAPFGTYYDKEKLKLFPDDSLVPFPIEMGKRKPYTERTNAVKAMGIKPASFVRDLVKKRLGGATLLELHDFTIAKLNGSHPWGRYTGMGRALSNEQYEIAGLISKTDRARLVRMRDAARARQPRRGQYGHPLTKIMQCGDCADAGLPSLMTANTFAGERAYLVCANTTNHKNKKMFLVMESGDSPKSANYHFQKFVKILAESREFARRWAAAPLNEKTEQQRKQLTEQLKTVRGEIATISKQLANKVADQLQRDDKIVAAQVRQVLASLSAKKTNLEAQADQIEGDLAALPTHEQREAGALQKLLAGSPAKFYRSLYGENAANKDVADNAWARKLCAEIGHPVLYRDGSWGPLQLDWPCWFELMARVSKK